MKKKSFDVRTLVLMALFTGLIILLGVTSIGIISIGPVGATTIHIPVIIGALMLGEKYGAVLGFVFGTVSLLVATYMPFIGAFAFSPFAPGLEGQTGNPLSLVVCYLPRILIGVAAPLTFRLLIRLTKKPLLSYGGAALAGSLVNTIPVLGLIYLFFGQGYAEAVGVAYPALIGAMLTTVALQGIPEAVIAVLLAVALGKVFDLQKLQKKAADPPARPE